jgi:hypothetical protein
MKKTYDKPKMEILDLRGFTGVLASSDDDNDSPGNSAFGHKNACSHGASKWFCD